MYYVLIIFILIIYYNFNTRDLSVDNKKKENLCCFIICLILVILAAFRSNEVGTDTLYYRYQYEEVLGNYDTYSSFIKGMSLDYIGYYGLSKLFHLMNMPVQVWFGFIEAIYLYALMLLVNRFSKDKIFSLLVFVTIGLFTFSMAGLKQTLAASFILFSFILFIDKKYLLSAVFIILTYYTHPAALILLFAFPCYLLRNSKYLGTVCFISGVLIYFYSTTFIGVLIDSLDNDHFQMYNINESSYSYVTFIFYATITLLCFLYFRNYKINSQGSWFIMGMSMLACGLQLLAGVSPSLFRLANMYVPFMMVLLPNTTFYVDQDNRKILKFILMGCIIFYFLYAGRNSSYSLM